MGERDGFAANNKGVDGNQPLNSVDILKHHNSFSIAKEPGLIGANVAGATLLAGVSKIVMDSIVYDGYSIQPLFHKSDCLLDPHPNTFEPIPNSQMRSSGFLRSHFENSEATKLARQAVLDRTASKETMSAFSTARKAAETEVNLLHRTFGPNQTESIFGSFANKKALGQNILGMNETALAQATKSFKLGESEVGLINGARQALQTEASMVAANARASETYSKAIDVLAKPANAAIGRNVGRTLIVGTAAVGANLLVDRAAVGLADNYYGQGSKLGKVMETNAVGLSLSTFAAIAAPDLRSKVVLATGGWLVGKAYNYFTDA